MSNEIPTLETPSGNSPINPQIEEEFNRGDYDPMDSELKGLDVEATEFLKEASGILDSRQIRRLEFYSEIYNDMEDIGRRKEEIGQIKGMVNAVRVG